MIVFCDDDTCRNNHFGACMAPNIRVTVSEGVKDDGSRGAVNICKDYKGVEDGTD